MARGASLRAVLFRGVGFAALWIVLIGTNHMPTGIVTALAAAWSSVQLLPPGSVQLRPLALPRLLLRFAAQSVLAGWDVARRALDARLPLRPGFVTYAVGFPPGPARNAFAALTSLVPGTVPAGEEGGALLYHCLDVGQPVAAQLAREEEAFARVVGGPPRDA